MKFGVAEFKLIQSLCATNGPDLQIVDIHWASLTSVKLFWLIPTENVAQSISYNFCIQSFF